MKQTLLTITGGKIFDSDEVSDSFDDEESGEDSEIGSSDDINADIPLIDSDGNKHVIEHNFCPHFLPLLKSD